MTMLYNRSDLSMPRTGIHGGLRRGAAAAAIGAVLVLTTGVPASQAKEGAPDPGAPAVDTTSLPVVPLKGQSGDARQDAPGQNREGKNGKGKAPADKGKGADPGQPASPSPVATPSASAIPSALRPAVKATPKPAAPSATAPASPVPTSSAPAASTPTPTRSATSAPAASATASSETAPGAAPPVPVPVPESPAAGAPAAPETPAAAVATTPAKPAPTPSAVAGDSSTTTTAAGQPAAAASAATTAAVTGGVRGQGGYVPLYAVPRTQAGWTPYAAAPNVNSVRSSAVLAAQPEPKSALVWLGSGLVGVAGAAGLVFFRLRNP
jgi:hypothetical protein